MPPSRHSISALDNHLPCQDSLDPAEEALHPSPSRSLLSFARHGPSVLAAPNLTEPTPDSPLASTKYDLEVPAARGGEGPHSCPPRRSKRRGAELSENAAGLLIGAADRVRTAMLEQLHELASPRSRHALQRALQPLPNGNHRSKTVQYTHSKHAGPSYESDLDAEVAWVQGTESSGKVAQERSWSVPPTRAESSALWQRSLYPMLSAASRSEMAEFKGLLVESLKKAGQSERGEEWWQIQMLTLGDYVCSC